MTMACQALETTKNLYEVIHTTMLFFKSLSEKKWRFEVIAC